MSTWNDVEQILKSKAQLQADAQRAAVQENDRIHADFDRMASAITVNLQGLFDILLVRSVVPPALGVKPGEMTVTVGASTVGVRLDPRPPSFTLVSTGTADIKVIYNRAAGWWAFEQNPNVPVDVPRYLGDLARGTVATLTLKP